MEREAVGQEGFSLQTRPPNKLLKQTAARRGLHRALCLSPVQVARARSSLAAAVFRFWMRPQLNSGTLGGRIMPLAPAEFPFMVADGEQIDIGFADGDLVLRFVDIGERPVEYRFREVLAFRWSARPTIETPRDDTAYQVLESAWLVDEVRCEGYPNPGDFAHYLLCFNAAKCLEVICRRLPAGHSSGDSSV